MELKTALLIDGTNLPPAILIRENEKQNYVTQGRAGDVPRNFKFVRPVTQKVGDEDRTLFLYQLVGLPNDDFNAVAERQADEYLNPEKYTKISSKPLNTDERAELERYRKQFGAIK